MKDEFKSLPACISLAAGAIVSGVLFFKDVELTRFLLIVFLVLVGFLIFGYIVRAVLVKLLDKVKTPEEKPEDDMTFEAKETNVEVSDVQNESEQ